MFVPGKLSEMWEPQRDFAFAKLPHTQQQIQTNNTVYKPPVETICGMINSSLKQGQVLMVATSDGFIYQYALDDKIGGPCELIRQYSLLETQ